MIRLLCLILISGQLAALAREEAADHSVELVIVGLRHGYRAPCSFLKDEENRDKLAGEKECMLVEIGRRQAFGLGALLRRRYSHLLGDRIDKDELLSYSSSADRAKETMEWLQRGLVAGDAEDYAVDAAPTNLGYEIDVPMLRAYKLQDCPVNTNGWADVEEEKLGFIQDDLRANRRLLDYASRFTNTEEAGGLSANNYGNLGDIADNIAIFRDMNLGQPSWITNPSLEGMSSDEIRDKLISFQDASQFACARYEPCANAMGGYWLHRVMELIGTKAAGGLPKTKLVLMTSHSETTLSLMRLMGFTRTKLDFAAGFIIEVRRLGLNRPEVRLLYHEPDHHHPLTRHVESPKLSTSCYRAGTADAWCPLGSFVASNSPKAIPNIRALCIEEGLSHACARNQSYKACGPLRPDCAPSCGPIPSDCSGCGEPGCFCDGSLLRDAHGNCRRRRLVCARPQRDASFASPYRRSAAVTAVASSAALFLSLAAAVMTLGL